MNALTALRRGFNRRNIKTKGLALLIEHAPCCLLSVAASFAGLPFLRHNPLLELGFALGGAMIGEFIGHRYFHVHDGVHTHGNGVRSTVLRYSFAIMIGLATWGVHQAYFHEDTPHQHEPFRPHRIQGEPGYGHGHAY